MNYSLLLPAVMLFSSFWLIGAVDLSVAKSAKPSFGLQNSPDNSKNRYNRLVDEPSPYLRQHAANPVDWFPWGAEAFETARKEDKPIWWNSMIPNRAVLGPHRNFLLLPACSFCCDAITTGSISSPWPWLKRR